MPSAFSPFANRLVAVARDLCRAVNALSFTRHVAFVYNPLDYAWPAHEQYLRRFGQSRQRVVFLGMNPGPYGMVQTGVPFGEVRAVRTWLRIDAKVRRPVREHPRRPILGLAGERSEVSGARLWGLFRERFDSLAAFFREHFVVNYCPLAFLDKSGRNLTPDKLARRQSARLFDACDEHLGRVVEILEPKWVIGVGSFATHQARRALARHKVRTGRILHPSPASPAANRNWSAQAVAQLEALGVW